MPPEPPTPESRQPRNRPRLPRKSHCRFKGQGTHDDDEGREEDEASDEAARMVDELKYEDDLGWGGVARGREGVGFAVGVKGERVGCLGEVVHGPAVDLLLEEDTEKGEHDC